MIPIVRVAERSKITADEYLAWEREQTERHEFVDGDVFAMAGGTLRHSALAVAIAAQLDRQLRGRCTVHSSDQRVGWLDRRRYAYPDVTVVCGPPEIESGDTIVNPTLIVEVLSASTEAYDRGGKWRAYRRLASLRDYVVVSQSEPLIEAYRRTEYGWEYWAAGPGEQLTTGIGAILDVDQLYAGMMSLPGDPPDEHRSDEPHEA